MELPEVIIETHKFFIQRYNKEDERWLNVAYEDDLNIAIKTLEGFRFFWSSNEYRLVKKVSIEKVFVIDID